MKLFREQQVAEKRVLLNHSDVVCVEQNPEGENEFL